LDVTAMKEVWHMALRIANDIHKITKNARLLV
jgi:hypothetical protein